VSACSYTRDSHLYDDGQTGSQLLKPAISLTTPLWWGIVQHPFNGLCWLVGAIGNVISVPIHATMLYGKSDADPTPATPLAEAAGFGFVPGAIVGPMEE
jgi:hypothetical protein